MKINGKFKMMRKFWGGECYLSTVQCPHCARVECVAFGYWSALVCRGCGEAVGRPEHKRKAAA